jgi:UDP-N-acetylglucosamine 2-epimerase (non-hydrolysing)
VITDHISDFLFAVTETQKNILQKEGIDNKKIFTVGNTVADALIGNIERASKFSQILKNLNIAKKDYILFTAHRASNVDDKNHFSEIIEILESVEQKIIWPMHPRAKKKLNEFNLTLPKNVIEIEPTGYLDFLDLLVNCNMAISDSGGVQEEACILNIPCLTIRENTERPETLEVGANFLVGRNKEKILDYIKNSKTYFGKWTSPFGDGKTAQHILDIVQGKPQTKENKKTNNAKSISVIGMGYMGLPISCLLATAGHVVTGIDISLEKIEKINQGITPFVEIGLDEVLKIALENNFKASLELKSSDIYLIAVPTPEINHACDLSMVMSAVESIAKVARNEQLVLLESTVKPNTCKEHLQKYFTSKGLNLEIAFTPERAFPGNTLHELVFNDRVVGGLTTKATELAYEVYASFVKGEIFKTNATTAESVKLFENTFRDVNIALANEFEEVARELEMNIWEVIKLANKHPRVNILNPGPGVGGHCIAIDPWFLVEDTKSGELIRLSRKINDTKPFIVVKRALELLGKNKHVGILGAAFKKDVDDCRESPALTIYDELVKAGIEVKFHDPHVENFKNYFFEKDFNSFQSFSDLIIVATDHTEFDGITISKPLIDTRNLLKVSK